MPSVERDLNDLKSVKACLDLAIKCFPAIKYRENEVQIRHDTIRHFLGFMQNEINEGIKMWQEELDYKQQGGPK